MTRPRFLELATTPLMIAIAAAWLAGAPAIPVQAQTKAGSAASLTKIRIATPTPSLSYLPIYAAIRKGFFAKRGFDIEIIQIAAGLSSAALLNHAVDYTTIPSTPATAAARGAPLKVICFASVKLQHLLISRPEIKQVADLAGKRIGAGGFGSLPAYEVQFVIERYKLGPNTIIVPVQSTQDRLIATQRGTVDAAIISAPLDLKGEEMGLKRLIHMGTILQIPQAGLATTEEKLKKSRREVIDMLKASIEGLEYTWAQREGVIEIIGKWMNLSPSQSEKAYESVKDTFSRNCIPSDEQSKAYVAMLTATAGFSPDLAASTIFDFSAAAEATREMRPVS